MATGPSTTGTSVMDLAQEATARTMILALIHRYAYLARENCDFAGLAKLYQPDGVVHLPDGREFAPQDLGGILGDHPPELLRHHATTTDIQFISANEAHCETYVIAETNLKPSDHWGVWKDVVCKQGDGRWAFKEKTIVLNGLDPEGWLGKSSIEKTFIP